MNKEIDIDEKLRNVRPSDKLSYKLILASKVNDCLTHVNEPDFREKVMGLKDSMYFDLPGLPWKKLIDQRIKELDVEYKTAIRKAVSEFAYELAFPWNRIPALDDLQKQYYHYLMQFCIDVLARFNALVEPTDFVDRGDEFING